MPFKVIRSYAYLKKAAAESNHSLGVLSADKKDLICRVCDEILAGSLNEHFPLVVWQTGSGTQTNMNVNEVIANRGHVINGGYLDDNNKVLHPNDDVNKSQSSNDTFPTAMHIAAYSICKEITLPGLMRVQSELTNRSIDFKDIVKIGRTHCMDAVPIKLSQEFSGYISQISHGIRNLVFYADYLLELPVGGTAIGTGLNTPEGFDEIVIQKLSAYTNYTFKISENKYRDIATHDILVGASSALKNLAVSLMKIANDLRMLSSGPRCGLGEIKLPANEPGSSIMPGKVNPTQIEALTMVCSQIIGNDAAITCGGMQGHFELNTFKPMIIYNLLQSLQLTGDACKSFADLCLAGLKPDKSMIEKHLENSLMLVTALNPHIGYEKAAIIAKKAYDENKTLRQAALELNILDEKAFSDIVDPKKMTGDQ
jgi:fumarate hydratase class II